MVTSIEVCPRCKKDDHENCYNLVTYGLGKLECICNLGYDGYEDKKRLHKKKAQYSPEMIEEANDYEITIIASARNLLRTLGGYCD